MLWSTIHTTRKAAASVAFRRYCWQHARNPAPRSPGGPHNRRGPEHEGRDPVAMWRWPRRLWCLGGSRRACGLRVCWRFTHTSVMEGKGACGKAQSERHALGCHCTNLKEYLTQHKSSPPLARSQSSTIMSTTLPTTASLAAAPRRNESSKASGSMVPARQGPNPRPGTQCWVPRNGAERRAERSSSFCFSSILLLLISFVPCSVRCHVAESPPRPLLALARLHSPPLDRPHSPPQAMVALSSVPLPA